jgi:hypothetical protein
MEDKITIIEGPPPTFEAVADGWVLGLSESPELYNVGVTRLRTFNGPALIERCHRAWRNQNTINLEYRETDGLQAAAPILAARTVESEEGQVLVLWVRLDVDESELIDDLDDDDDIDISDDDLDGDFSDDFDDNNPIL